MLDGSPDVASASHPPLALCGNERSLSHAVSDEPPGNASQGGGLGPAAIDSGAGGVAVLAGPPRPRDSGSIGSSVGQAGLKTSNADMCRSESPRRWYDPDASGDDEAGPLNARQRRDIDHNHGGIAKFGDERTPAPPTSHWAQVTAPQTHHC